MIEMKCIRAAWVYSITSYVPDFLCQSVKIDDGAESFPSAGSSLVEDVSLITRSCQANVSILPVLESVSGTWPQSVSFPPPLTTQMIRRRDLLEDKSDSSETEPASTMRVSNSAIFKRPVVSSVCCESGIKIVENE